jgi:glycine/D-amino acid oxidase-like deaminating enzyme
MVRGNVRVVSVRETAARVRVESSAGPHEVDRAVVAAGPWIADLIPELHDLLTVTRHVYCRVGTRDPDLVAPPLSPSSYWTRTTGGIFIICLLTVCPA